MPYIAPSLEQLKKDIDALSATYGTNADRSKVVTALQTYMEKHSHQIMPEDLIALQLLCMKKCDEEYTGGNSTPVKISLFGYKLKWGSDLKGILSKNINRANNEKSAILLENDPIASFTYWVRLRNLLKIDFTLTKNLAEAFGVKPDNLKAEVNKKILELFKQQAPIFNAVKRQQLTAEDLENNIKEIDNYYSAEKNPKRKTQIALMKVMNAIADLLNKPAENLTESQKQIIDPRFKMRMGVALLVMLQIEKDYANYSVGYKSYAIGLSPERSKLYRFCQSITGINRSWDLSAAQKAEYLNEITGKLDPKFLDILETNPPNFLQDEIKDLKNAEKLSGIKSAAGSYIQQFTQEDKEMTGVLENNKVAAALGNNIGYIVEYGINTTTDVLTRRIVPHVEGLEKIGAAVGALLLTPLGLQFIGAAVGWAAGAHLSKTYIPSMFGSAAVAIGKNLSQAVGKITATGIKLVLYPVEGGLRILLSADPKIREEQEKAILDNKNLIEDILALGPDFFVQQAKVKNEPLQDIVVQGDDEYKNLISNSM